MMNLDLGQKRTFLYALERVAREVGQHVLSLRKLDICDTHDYKGHESSTIDSCARDFMQTCLERHLPEFEGKVRFELRPITKSLMEKEEHVDLVLIIDEIEGTTNTKRCLASAFDEYRPQAVISLALSLSDSLKDVVASVVYTLDLGETFSALRVEGDKFLAFLNQKLIDPELVIHTRGDSRRRVLVIGYSNSHRLKKGELEQTIYDQGFRVYEGCRASGMDMVNLIRNQTDAYIDLRRFWSTKGSSGKEKEAMLEVYDCAGVLPIAEGCGLVVTDAEGNSWHDYQLNDAIPLVVARPDIHPKILETIQPLVEKWKGKK